MKFSRTKVDNYISRVYTMFSLRILEISSCGSNMVRWYSIVDPVQASSLSCQICEPSRLRTIPIIKSVHFTYGLFVSYYVLVLKVIRLLLFGPSRSINCIDGLLMEKVECILKYKLLITKVYRIVENFEKDDLRVIRQELALAMMEE